MDSSSTAKEIICLGPSELVAVVGDNVVVVDEPTRQDAVVPPSAPPLAPTDRHLAGASSGLISGAQLAGGTLWGQALQSGGPLAAVDSPSPVAGQGEPIVPFRTRSKFAVVASTAVGAAPSIGSCTRLSNAPANKEPKGAAVVLAAAAAVAAAADDDDDDDDAAVANLLSFLFLTCALLFIL